VTWTGSDLPMTRLPRTPGAKRRAVTAWTWWLSRKTWRATSNVSTKTWSRQGLKPVLYEGCIFRKRMGEGAASSPPPYPTQRP